MSIVKFKLLFSLNRGSEWGGGGGGGEGVWGMGLSHSGTSLSKLLATRFSTLSPICGIIYLFIYIETTCCSSRVLNIILT